MPADPLAHELARLIAFPTISDRPLDGLGGYLTERLEALGFEVERIPDAHHPHKFSLVGRCGPEDPINGLTLSGHMDVVPTEGQPWSSDPFQLTERDGRWYGRGSADMKGFFAASLFALDRIRRSDLTRQVAVVFTHDEEVGCLGSAQIADTWGGRTPLPDACIIGEPTGFQILRMHPGHAVAEIEIRGKAAHSSMPQKGINAIAIAARVVTALQELAAAWVAPRSQFSGESGGPWVPLNVARIDGGSAVNIVPDRCTIQVGFRPPPGTLAESLFAEMVGEISKVEPDANIRLARVTPSLLTPLGTPLERLLSRFSSTPDIGMASFATDGGQLARIGLAPLIFGPGSIEVAHRADEYVEAAALHRAVDVLEAIVRARCT